MRGFSFVGSLSFPLPHRLGVAEVAFLVTRVGGPRHPQDPRGGERLEWGGVAPWHFLLGQLCPVGVPSTDSTAWTQKAVLGDLPGVPLGGGVGPCRADGGGTYGLGAPGRIPSTLLAWGTVGGASRPGRTGCEGLL